MTLEELVAHWREYTSVTGNDYDEGFEAGLGEAAAQLEQWLERTSPR